MDVALSPVDPVADRAALVAFLSSNRFPFHVVERPSAAEAEARVDRGGFGGPENLAFWVVAGASGRVGVIVFEEVTDGTPLIDLRIGEAWRGRGIGGAALALGTAAVFAAHPAMTRIEGNTRVDNRAMRRAFVAAGYVKEAHYREGWPVAGGAPVDAVAYAVLRRDWETGVTTPVSWEA